MPDVLITGVGVVSPLGASLDELVARVTRGERAEQLAGGMTVENVPLDHVPAPLRARMGRADRLCRFFAAAAYAAVDDARLAGFEDSERVGLSFGTAYGCLATDLAYHDGILDKGVSFASPRLFAYTVSSAAAGEVSIGLGIHGPNLTSHAGHAAGLAAIVEAVGWIRSGRADVVLAGGADALESAGLEALDAMALPKVGATFLPSEGAAVLVLESQESARRRGVDGLARVLETATGFEPGAYAPEHDSRGIAAVLHVVRDGIPGEIDAVLSSAAGLSSDRAEAEALEKVFGEATLPVIVRPKQALGDTFGAAGPLALALASGGWPGPSPADRSRPERCFVVTSVCPFGPVAAVAIEAADDAAPRGHRESCEGPAFRSGKPGR